MGINDLMSLRCKMYRPTIAFSFLAFTYYAVFAFA